MSSAPVARPLLAVIDDDESVRESLPDLLRLVGYAALPFSSAEAFLASDVVADTRCLILDVAMPGMSGPDLYRELARRGHHIPVVFITARDDESLRAELLALGATGCLFKPFDVQALLDAVHAALKRGDA